MSAAHTPGPWVALDHRILANQLHIGNMTKWWVSGISEDEFKSNARLIAESPNLLEVLKKYEIKFTDEKQARAEFGDFTVDRELLRRAAIVKATGRTT